MTHKEKQNIIQNLIHLPDKGRRVFWAKEIKFLNILYEKYPNKKFWTNLKFYDKLDSMLLFRSGYYAEELKSKYNRFNYKIPPPEKIEVGEIKISNNRREKKNKTLKDFLS